jgi:hypothetical protein
MVPQMNPPTNTGSTENTGHTEAIVSNKSEKNEKSASFVIEGTTARTTTKPTAHEKVVLVNLVNDQMVEATEPEKPRVKWTLLNKNDE